MMGVKFGTIIIILLISFIAKVTFETATAEKNAELTSAENERSPASIDRSYQDHLNRR
jgi:hypothetical protein